MINIYYVYIVKTKNNEIHETNIILKSLLSLQQLTQQMKQMYKNDYVRVELCNTMHIHEMNTMQNDDNVTYANYENVRVCKCTTNTNMMFM